MLKMPMILSILTMLIVAINHVGWLTDKNDNFFYLKGVKKMPYLISSRDIFTVDHSTKQDQWKSTSWERWMILIISRLYIYSRLLLLKSYPLGVGRYSLVKLDCWRVGARSLDICTTASRLLGIAFTSIFFQILFKQKSSLIKQLYFRTVS